MADPNPVSAAPTPGAVSLSPSLHWSEAGQWSVVSEPLAVEEPLTIEIAYLRAGQPVRKLLAVTMRTPGADEELAIGFLFAEGLIQRREDVSGGFAGETNGRGETIATWTVTLAAPPREDLQRVSRGLLTSSACGLCGRSSLAGLPLRAVDGAGAGPAWSVALLAGLPDQLQRRQTNFARTGGSHGAGLADAQGNLLLVREDVGRHNAVDKLIGGALRQNLSLADRVLVLSGRASFELIQKASAAGIPVVTAVGAPSSLAVSLAHSAGITLVGFARGHRCNVYTHAGRVQPLAAAAEAEPAARR
jgi:FdhD protein